MDTALRNQTHRPLPIEVDEIDAAWLTSALRVRAPNVTVKNFEIVDTIRGTCTKLRIRLDMNEAGRAAGIPDTIILKGGFEAHSRDLIFELKMEALAYRDLLADCPLNNPASYFADYDEERRQGIVIMEDLAPRNVTFGDPLRPRSYDNVAATLSLLAKFHAKTWGCPMFEPDGPLGWVQTSAPFSRPYLKPYLEPAAWQRCLGLPRGAAASVRFHDREWAIAALNRMEILAKQVPNCIIHGDTHLGNAFFAPDGTAGFVDPVLRRAPPLNEVSFHMNAALDTADRPGWERPLIQHYLGELKRNGVDAPSFDEAMRQYSAFLVEGFVAAFINPADCLPETPSAAYTARFSAAMLANDTVGVLSKIA